AILDSRRVGRITANIHAGSAISQIGRHDRSGTASRNALYPHGVSNVCARSIRRSEVLVLVPGTVHRPEQRIEVVERLSAGTSAHTNGRISHKIKRHAATAVTCSGAGAHRRVRIIYAQRNMVAATRSKTSDIVKAGVEQSRMN